MFSTVNTVVAGDYKGRKVKVKLFNRICLCRGFYTPIEVNSTTVDDYEVVSQDVTKSGTSAFCRGCLGQLLFGTIGMLAGCTSAKNKALTMVSVTFRNGDRSLIEMDQNVYKLLVKELYV